MLAPAARNSCPATCPSERSTKNVIGTGGSRLVADRFFDFMDLALVVSRERLHGVARPVAFRDDRGGDACPGQAWPPELDARVDGYGARIGRYLRARVRIQTNRQARPVAFDSPEVGVQDLFHGDLPLRRRAHQLTITADAEFF